MLSLGSGYRVLIAESAAEALEIVNECITDGQELPVVIADQLMPGMRGDELLIQLHQIYPQARKIMLTGQADASAVGNVVNQAALYRFMAKPWSREDLLLTITEAVKSFESEKELKLAAAKIEESEKKYRELVENSHEIIFSMSLDGSILTMNRAVTKYLSYPPAYFIGKKLLSFASKRPLGEPVIKEAMGLIEAQKFAQARCELLARTGEPREVALRMELVETESGPTIFCKASSVPEDELHRLIVSETQLYETGNYFSKVDLIAERVTGPVAKLVDNDTLWSLRLSLREILINAIEHGNLEIDFETKTRAQSGDYLAFLSSRVNDPQYANRKIEVEYKLTSGEVSYRIRDDGNGFDHRAVLGRSPDGKTQELSHGRGLILVVDCFDQVEFNEVGNEVRLVKRLVR